MTGGPLIEVVYISAATAPLSSAALAQLLSATRRNNLRAGVTGLLIHVDGSFLQVLEGPPDAVDAIYDRISKDPRHERVIRLSRRELSDRSFADWTMGYVEDVPGLRQQQGFNDFFRVGLKNARLTGPDTERVQELLRQFAIGRWRQHVRSA